MSDEQKIPHSLEHERHPGPNSCDLDIFIPDGPRAHCSTTGFTIDIFIPSDNTPRLSPTRRSRCFKHNIQNRQAYHQYVDRRKETPSTALFSNIRHVEPNDDPMILCTYSTLFSNTGASAYWIKRSKLLDVFPRAREIGWSNPALTGRSFFMTASHIHGLALEQAPMSALVDAHDVIFEHIIQPSPIFAKIQGKNQGRPGAANRICVDIYALSTMLCRSRGLGCGSWLLDDIATALGQFWATLGVSMNQEQQTSMFIASLGVFLDEIEKGGRGPPSGPLSEIYNIWSNLSGDTKLSIQRTVEFEDQHFRTDHYFFLKDALHEVIRGARGHTRHCEPTIGSQQPAQARHRNMDDGRDRRVTEGMIYDEELFFTSTPHGSDNERRWDTDLRNGFSLVQPLGMGRTCIF